MSAFSTIRLLLLALLPSVSLAQIPLPDPLKKQDGTVISTKEEWESSLRGETLRLFRENIYGIAPIGKPADFKSTVVKETKDAFDGKATVKHVEITFTTPKGPRTIRPVVVLPNGVEKPVAAFLLINNRRPDLLDPDNTNEFFPAREIIARGYAAVGFHYGDVDIDKKDGYADGIRSQYDSVPPAPDAWGSIAAWAWGASRVLDHLETEPRIDAKRVAVIGHSRGGKTSLWAGAQDQRFGMVISNNSGSTGSAIARDKKGESIKDINRVFPHWLSANYKKFDGKEAELPVDQHQLLGLIAPRPAYIASATKDGWADPTSEFRTCIQASPVYRLYGFETVTTRKFPEPEKPLKDGRVGYHLRTGEHNLTLYDWKNFMDFADLNLRP
ncbi:MAG TPA: alpha/beta hydrolase-fold protein [Luteolibacter sp.]|nr:alpha/beta hydrolase-fold protein [Luteolibacter sp.]